MRIEWASAKEEANRRKHGVGFSPAEFVLADPLTLLKFVRKPKGYYATGSKMVSIGGTLSALSEASFLLSCTAILTLMMTSVSV